MLRGSAVAVDETWVDGGWGRKLEVVQCVLRVHKVLVFLSAHMYTICCA